MTDLVSQLVGALEAATTELESHQGNPYCNLYDLPEFKAAIAQARAALTAAKAGGWVPIETAPKEESVLILRRGDLYPGVAFLSLDRWHWSSSGGWAGHPTHWQPLPTPPKEQS